MLKRVFDKFITSGKKIEDQKFILLLRFDLQMKAIKKTIFKLWVIILTVSIIIGIISLFFDQKKDIIQKPQPEPITVVSYTESVRAGSYASVTIDGKPNTKYCLSISYNSGESKAEGIGYKRTSPIGRAYWRWKVGTRTESGVYTIYISGPNSETNLDFRVY